VRPQSVEDIALAQRNWREIDCRRGIIRTKSRGLQQLAAVLRSHASAGRTEDTADIYAVSSSLEARWTSFDDQMEAFNEMIDVQKESLKARLEEEVIEQNQGIDKFVARWRALKPVDLTCWDVSSVNEIFNELNE